MSRTTYLTPMRRSRRLLNNGYYYSDDVDSSFDERSVQANDDDDDDDGLLQRRVLYTNCDSPKKRGHKKQQQKRNSKQVVVSGGGAVRGADAGGDGISSRTVRTFHRKTTTISNNMRRVEQEEEEQRTTTTHQHQANHHHHHHNIQHLFGLENDDEYDPITNGGGFPGKSRRKQLPAIASPPVVALAATAASGFHHTPPLREAPGRRKIGGSYEAGDAGAMTTATAPSGGFYSDGEETVPTTTAAEKGSSRKSKDSLKKRRSKQETKRNFLVQNFSSLASSVTDNAKFIYQTVAYFLVLDSWLLRTTGDDSSNGARLLSRMLQKLAQWFVLVAAVAVAALLSHQPQLIERFVASKRPPPPAAYPHRFTAYLNHLWYGSDDRGGGGEGMAGYGDKFENSAEYRRLVAKMKSIENSLHSLTGKMKSGDDENRKMIESSVRKGDRDVRDNIATATRTIQQTFRTENSELDAKVERRLSAVVASLDDKIANLQTELSKVDTRATAAGEDGARKNSIIEDELASTRRSMGLFRIELDKIITDLDRVERQTRSLSRLDLPGGGSNQKKIELLKYDRSEMEAIADEAFVRNFVNLMRSISSQHHRYQSSDGLSELHQLLLTWMESMDFVTHNQFARFVSLNLTEEIRSEVAVRVQQAVEQRQQFFKDQSRDNDASGSSTSRFQAIAKRLLGKYGVSEREVRALINHALDGYSADRIGMADYALESSGGHIISTRCSQTYDHKTPVIRILGYPIYWNLNTPRSVIQPSVMPGECWAFTGDVGYVVIGLSLPIYPSSVTLEHIPQAIALLNTSSAPQNFSVYGLDSPSQYEGTHLGDFRYEKDGPSVQNFMIERSGAEGSERRRLFAFVEMRVTSNWGHPDYTCVYRFRVHGTRG